mmetsp:Transcript_56511/g.126251  ORF Transcript_56511/g.126251 Transcript_56511/m.126251 type:complete len:100 (+) Transcript_56511:560-859(+)
MMRVYDTSPETSWPISPSGERGSSGDGSVGGCTGGDGDTRDDGDEPLWGGKPPVLGGGLGGHVTTSGVGSQQLAGELGLQFCLGANQLSRALSPGQDVA